MVGIIVRMGALGAANRVPDTVLYSAPNMRSPSILCLPLPIVVMMDAPLAQKFPTRYFDMVAFDLVVHFGVSQYG